MKLAEILDIADSAKTNVIFVRDFLMYWEKGSIEVDVRKINKVVANY